MSVNFTHYETVLMMVALESQKSKSVAVLSELQCTLPYPGCFESFCRIDTIEEDIAVMESALDKLSTLRSEALNK